MKTLSLWVAGGLCNRLSALLSAQFACDRAGRSLSVFWPCGPGCLARFGQLFVSPLDLLHKFPAKPIGGSNRDHWPLIDSAAEHLAIRSCYYLIPPEQRGGLIPYLDRLQPISTVTECVAEMAAQFRGRTVGVHVRRGDFLREFRRKYRSKTPAMKQYFDLIGDDFDTIFLASDGRDVTTPFQRRYGDRLVVYSKRSVTRSAIGVQDALVDLLLLRRCDRIVGTQWSSFSQLASLGKPSQIVRPERIQAGAVERV